MYHGFLTSFCSYVSHGKKKRGKLKLPEESLALQSFVSLSGKSTQLSHLILGCLGWWGHRHTCCSLSSLSFFSLDLTLLVLTLGLQSKTHTFSQASQTTLFLCWESKPLPEAAPFPCYALIAPYTPHSTISHLWVPPLNSDPPSSPLGKVSQPFEPALNKGIA